MRVTRNLTLIAIAGLVACSTDDGPPTGPPPTEPPLKRLAVLPDGWSGTRGSAEYTVGIDSGRARQGSTSAYLVARVLAPASAAQLLQSVRADLYRGRRVRLSGWVQPVGITGQGGLMMRVDGPRQTQAFDNMLDERAVVGDGDWREESIVLDVPADAAGIAFGALLVGGGELRVDDFRLEVVDESVPSTDLMEGPEPPGADRTSLYASSRMQPINLDLEGVDVRPHAAALVAWLRDEVVPVARTTPGTDLEDLEPLGQMVGDARIVALGEGTHGTREFFQLKHRILEFLVQRMGFTHFAIEARWAESNDVNHYVLTGEGNPGVLLDRLGFWTWDTEEVLELILWMRRWNETAPPERRVQFVGVDMQSPGAPIDSVLAAAARISASERLQMEEDLQCIIRYRNYGNRYSGSPMTDYAATPAWYRESCRASLTRVSAWLHAHEAEIAATSAPGTYARVVQSMRIIQQFEHFAAVVQSTSSSTAVRDSAMAENTRWHLEQAPPTARFVMWAHNAHVANRAPMMGRHLRLTYGDDYLSLGFLFGLGSFNAVGPSGSVSAMTTQHVPRDSWEAAFLAAGVQLGLLDTRRIPMDGSAAAALRDLMPVRSIGAGFDPAREADYFTIGAVPREFDLLLFVSASRPTRLR